MKSGYREGILRSASLMPNGAAFDGAVHIAGENPGLGVGVHVSLVDERSVAPADRLDGLVDENGVLPRSYRAFAKAFLTRRFGVVEVRTEVEAQVAKVLAAGISPTHIDFHQHVHMLPGVFEVALAVARSAGIRVIRIPYDRTRRSGPVARRMQTRILLAFCLRNARRLAKTGIRPADHFHGLGQSGAMHEANLLTTLDCLRPGVNEVMMHPGFSDSAMAARYSWGYHWNEEHEALVSPRVQTEIADRHIRLANFAEAWLA